MFIKNSKKHNIITLDKKYTIIYLLNIFILYILLVIITARPKKNTEVFRYLYHKIGMTFEWLFCVFLVICFFWCCNIYSSFYCLKLFLKLKWVFQLLVIALKLFCINKKNFYNLKALIKNFFICLFLVIWIFFLCWLIFIFRLFVYFYFFDFEKLG